MKKLLCLIVGMAFLVGSAATTMAGELDIYGQYWGVVSVVDNAASFKDNPFNEDVDGDDWQGYQRVRQYFEYIASDNLKAVVGYEFDTLWGDGGSGNLGADANNFELKRAMLDWTLANGMSFNIGVQGFAVPGGATGNPVLGGDMSGITANVPFNDMMSLTAGWIRLNDEVDAAGNDGIGADGSGDADAFVVALPINAQGFNVSPYGIYAYLGEDAINGAKFGGSTQLLGTFAGDAEFGVGASPDDNANAYWIGAPFTLSMMDPLVLKGQFIYGSVTGMDVATAGVDDDALERTGFYADFSAAFKTDFGTPTVFGLYSSGEDDDLDDGSETFPTLFSDGYASGGPFTTAFGFNGCCSNISFGADYSFAQYTPHGIWKLGLGIQDFSFLPNLSHDIGVAYIQGTHDEDVVAQIPAGASYVPTASADVELTTEDSAWELRWYSEYSVNENLDLVLDLGYATMDMDSGVWGSDYLDDDVIYGSTAIAYSF
jgi:hypothetical protein